MAAEFDHVRFERFLEDKAALIDAEMDRLARLYWSYANERSHKRANDVHELFKTYESARFQVVTVMQIYERCGRTLNIPTSRPGGIIPRDLNVTA